MALAYEFFEFIKKENQLRVQSSHKCHYIIFLVILLLETIIIMEYIIHESKNEFIKYPYYVGKTSKLNFFQIS